MDEPITVERIDQPRLRRQDEDGDLVDLQGWLHAPVSWTHERDLEKLWNRKHSSRLGVGLSVAGNPRRHFLLRNVRRDLDWVKTELEALVAQIEETAHPDAGVASVGGITAAPGDQQPPA